MKYIFLFLLLPIVLFSQSKGASPIVVVSNQSSVVSNTYAVVVGISDYQDNNIPDLRFADKDAEAFGNYLRASAGGQLDNDHLKVLLNEKATVAQFAIALDWLMEVVKENDQVIIYFSGHGDVEKKTITQPGYLLCWDAPSRVYLAGGALALPMFQDIITTLSVQNKAKVIVITDACRSGKLAGSSVGGSQITGANLAKQYSNEIKILSCQPNEYSIEGEQWGGGRGAFSYHLIDALYGMADNNNDLIVNLQEAGRYIEDHVSSEVAPVSQIPMVLGNRTDALSKVDPILLASIKTGKTSQMSFLSSIDSRGIEDDILASADTTIRLTYTLFKQALKDKIFLEPVNACADMYYKKLIQEPTIERLHSTLKRNYAAALQDDAQSILNTLLRTGIERALTNAESSGESYTQFPKLLNRAAELLGKEHYFYNSLMARKFFFESYLVKSFETKMNKCRLSLSLLNEFPLAYWRMANIQAYHFKNLDSAQYYCKKAIESAPVWVRPYCDMGSYCNVASTAEIYFQKAYELDSASAVLWYTKGLFYKSRLNLPDDGIHYYEKALKAANSDELCFPCIYINLGSLNTAKREYEKAIDLYQIGLINDSMNATILSNLGSVYIMIGNYDSAIHFLKMAVEIRPDKSDTKNNLAEAYFRQKNYTLAEVTILEALQIDSDEPILLETYADILLAIGKQELAFINYTKSYLSSIVKFKTENAKTILDKLLLIEPTRKESLQLKTDFETKYNHNNASLAWGYKSVLRDSMKSEGWLYIGHGYRNMKEYAKAILYYTRAILLDSTKIEYRMHRAICESELNNPDKAIEDLEFVLKHDSLNCTALYSLGHTYFKSGIYDKGELFLTQAIDCDPKYANPYVLLGMLLFKTKRFEESKKHFLKSIELNSNNSLAYLGMAYVSITENKINEAIIYVETAIQKKIPYIDLEKDENLASIKMLEQWNDLMHKHFPEQFKD